MGDQLTEFGPVIESKDVTVRTCDVEVTEHYIGTYTMPALELSVGAERVEFRPKGIMMLGAEGRVDIRGEGDTVTPIKSAENGDSEWTVVVQRVPHLRTAPLDRDSAEVCSRRSGYRFCVAVV
jgi:hypothetical protein